MDTPCDPGFGRSLMNSAEKSIFAQLEKYEHSLCIKKTKIIEWEIDIVA